MTVTPIYAGILGILFLALSLRVIGRRRTARVGLGDGGDRVLFRVQRAQANFAEYVPLILLLMTVAELQGTGNWALHAIGILLLVGRAVHAVGFGREPEIPGARVAGMAMTFTALGFAALASLLPAAARALGG
ncbi:MAPEG family protein [Thalassobaculum sp.]|uniref:MAPEG family protein n=1 Tax=Thalassobaculum sp. TaxID=2022740 RepID=UPI0032EB97C7